MNNASPQTDPKLSTNWGLAPPEPRRWVIPTSGYIFALVAVIGLLLLLSGDFGESWDVAGRERSALIAYTYYFNGFDSAQFRANPDLDINYGPLLDVLIRIAQDTTADALQRFQIRVFLQALLSLSCLIPVFLISTRVVSKPLALIAVALVAVTPVFFGHAFINPKDSIFASGFLWAFYIILYCFEDGRRPSYWALIGLAVLLGVVTSLRLIGAYLLPLVPLAGIILPALRAQEANVSFRRRLRDQTTLQIRSLAVLLLTFAITYTLSMPAILSDFSAYGFIETILDIMHHGWHGTVLYFGDHIFPELPWHYIYGYMLVQFPLYYHFFLLTILATSMLLPRTTLWSLRDFLRSRERALTVILLLTALIIPLALILFVQSIRYDGFRHVLFIVPLVCMPLYFGFVAAVAQMRKFARVILVVLATLCWSEAVFANWSLHPYEYVYYNPLVNPAGSFELDYWATAFREVAERLNDYARKATKRGERLHLVVCGPSQTLTHYLDPDMFDVLHLEWDHGLSTNSFLDPAKAFDFPSGEVAPQLTVALNRGGCMALVREPWLISVKRGNLVFAVVVARS
jgi:4-amino-4-deoxy-L-arabinose transferase-like glycosyltransferase